MRPLYLSPTSWFILPIVCMHAKSLQLCPTLCDPMDCSPPCFSVHVILQARILEWVAVPCFRGFPDPGIKPMSLCLLHWQVGSLPLAPPGKPHIAYCQPPNALFLCLLKCASFQCPEFPVPFGKTCGC